MQKFRLKLRAIFFSVILLLSLMGLGPSAWAKRKHPPKAYSFITEGGKASQGECDGEGKIPRKLKRLKEFNKTGSYMGSELQKPEIKGKNDDEMWKHFYRAKPACNTVLGKTPSSLNEAVKNTKVELPPDDSDDEGPDDSPDAPDAE